MSHLMINPTPLLLRGLAGNQLPTDCTFTDIIFAWQLAAEDHNAILPERPVLNPALVNFLLAPVPAPVPAQGPAVTHDPAVDNETAVTNEPVIDNEPAIDNELAISYNYEQASSANEPGVTYEPTPTAEEPAVSYQPTPTIKEPTTTYEPTTIVEEPVPEQTVAPIYPAYQGYFRSGEAAKAHRKSERRARKEDKHVAFVKKHGREYWVRRLYEAMIDISDVADGNKSTHYDRFVNKAAFDPKDLEATAHHIFEKACAVHEKGWNRPLIYHKEAVRGSLVDISKNSVELRLDRICGLLRQNKSMCNDCLQGGLTLAQLVDNPYLRAGSKGSNNKGNQVRGQRLQVGKQLLGSLKQSKTAGSTIETPETPEVPDISESPHADTTPLDTAPLDTAPLDTAPLDTAPLDTAPLDTAPFDIAPFHTTPFDDDWFSS